MFQTLKSFTVVIASTGVAMPLVSITTPANRIDIQAAPGNAAALLVGASNITSDSLNGGISLSAGDVYNIELITDLKPIYIAGTAGDKVLVNFWIGDRN